MDGVDKITGLKKRIKGTLLRERLLLFSAGLLGTASALVLISIVLTLLAGIIILPVWLKVSLLAISGLAILGTFIKLAFARLFSNSPEIAALKLEKKFPMLRGRLIAALQFTAFPEDQWIGYSRDLMAATLRQAHEQSASLNFNEILSAYPLWRSLRVTGLMIVLAVLLLLGFPGLFSHSYLVYSHPTELIAPPLGYELTSYPGSRIAIKYRDVDLGGILIGDRFPDKATVYFRFVGGSWQNSRIDLGEIPRNPAALGDSLIFYTTIKQARRSLDYYVQAGPVTTPVERIDVVDRPRVTGIRLSLFYPDYTGLAPTVIDENDGTVSALYGTRTTMKIETNVSVQTAEMVFADSSRSPFTVSGRTAEQSFRVERDQGYSIHLIDMQGEINPDPIEYYITAVPDEYPVIDVVRPGIDINLNENMEVPLLLRISDDYGFSSLVLKYRHVSGGAKGEENVAVLHFSDNIKTEGEISFSWDVEPLGLMPSDYIIYQFELADNDRISGPKITTSRAYIARLPSLEEIIAQTEREQGEIINNAESYMKAHRDLAERLKNVSRKIEQERSAGDQKLGWQQQKELEDIATREEDIAEQLQQTARKMEEAIDKMEQDRLASTELLEKLSEIQKLFDEVATPEMRQARLQLLEALKNMDQQTLNEALQNYQMSQQELMQRLDRTIALLKKLQIEQKVNAMTELARELVEKQDKMNENTAATDADQLPSLAPGEKQLKRELDNLKVQARELRNLLDETSYVKADAADKFCSAVEQSDAGENMESMAVELSDRNKEQAIEQGGQASSKLLALFDQMQRGQASMCQGGGSEVAGQMRDAIDDINYLSENQEELITTADGMRYNSEVLRDIAAQQQLQRESVVGLLNRITEMGRQSPFIAAELHRIINNVIGNIDYSIEQFSDRRRNDGVTFQKEALANLNRAAIHMLDALQKQKDCNKGGSSCNKPTMKLNSLCQQQSQLNMQTQAQCQNPGRDGPGGRDALQRLAAEQNAIGKSLGQLAEEFGDSKEILGRLDAIAEDVQKVVDALEEGEVGQEVQDRQLRILSRMLDATKSLQRKDFTEQRQAASGKDILRNSPAALTGNQLNGGLDIEDRLRRFLDEEYPEAYEQHIKAYFKALLENLEMNTMQPGHETE
ncbi:MAG: hypothetical protein JSV44_09535 [Candidatus Zixiibacteriota bacterium]|nr:MAG: hypothetical protein JSV44_09535 [candidate division Zixibacteria bacterium]